MRGTVGVDVRGVAFVIGGFFRLAGADSERDCKSQTDCDELFHVVVVFDWGVGAEMFSAVRWVQCRAVQNPSRFFIPFGADTPKLASAWVGERVGDGQSLVRRRLLDVGRVFILLFRVGKTSARPGWR